MAAATEVFDFMLLTATIDRIGRRLLGLDATRGAFSGVESFESNSFFVFIWTSGFRLIFLFFGLYPRS